MIIKFIIDLNPIKNVFIINHDYYGLNMSYLNNLLIIITIFLLLTFFIRLSHNIKNEWYL